MKQYKCIKTFHEISISRLLIKMCFYKDRIYSYIPFGYKSFFEEYTLVDERKDKLKKLWN
jgi:hypothetical protein